MQKKATRFFTSFPEKSRLIQPVLLLLVLVSLACVLPEAISPQPTATRPDSKTAASPTPEPTLNAPYPAALLDTWPANGSGLERQPEISFYFNQPMKHDLVEKSISFQPAINGKFTWVDDATLKFSPDLPLPLQSDLKVDFGLQAQSQSGQAMVTPVTLTYHLPAALKINEKIPAPGAAAVDPSLPVLVSFNQPIMPLMVGAQSDDTPAFTLEPHTEGKGAWLNTSTYVFYPATALKGNTAYQLSLRADLAGSGEEKGWNFNTAQVSVKSVSPSPEKGPLGLDGAIQVQFNQPVNRQSVEKNASLRSDSSPSPIEGTITWNDNSTQMSFKPASLLTRDSSYAFVLSTAVQSASGENLAVDQSFKYHTAAALGLVESAPVQNGKITYDSNYSNITLKFNNGLGRQDLTSLVRLDPPVGDLNVYSVENNTLMVSGLFKPETNYHLAISDALVDRWGGKLAAPLALDFSTTAASASLNISMLEYSETLFLRPEDAALSAQAFNLNSLLVQSQRLQLGEFITLDGNYDAKNAFNLSQFDAWLLHYTNTNQGKAVQVSLSKTGAAIKPGLYYYRLTSPDLDKTNKKEVNFMAVVSHIQLTLKRSLKEMFVWAVDLNTNQPAAQKNISMVNPAGNVVGFCTTDPKGTCTVQLPTGERPGPGGVLRRHGKPG